MKFQHLFTHQSIRNKLLISYFSGFVVALLIGSLVIYFFLRTTLRTNIENELKGSTTSILNLVRTSATISLKNYLRAIVEKNHDIVKQIHQQVQLGLLSEPEAKKRAAILLLSQKIGTSGYIYCLDSQGVLQVHPKPALLGVNISDYSFARDQKQRKSGYLEYDWRNPDEKEERPKALQMTFFEPWDWIISASAYREEANQLVNVDDFRHTILSMRFGRTGYSYVMNSKGNLIIHPQLEGQNISAETDAGGRRFIREILERRSGTITYPWKNPDEQSSRQKLVIFNYIPELDWIVASSSYMDEFYAPLKTLRDLMLAGCMLSLCLFILITLKISAAITSPLKELESKFNHGATGDFSIRMHHEAKDEIGQLADYFNTFMQQLEIYHTNLNREIQETERLEREVMNISEKERLNIGRDLHDDLGPHLIGIEVLVKVLQSKLREQGLPENELAGKIRSLTKEAIGKTRALARGLCPVTIDSQGLRNSLEELAHNVETLFRIDCQLDCNCPVEFPDNTIATHLYYILHEAIHNAIKHGQARLVTIRIRQYEGRYRLIVDDDGVGIDIHQRLPPDGVGMGLRIMSFRAKKIGARLEVGAPAGGGTRIQIDFYESAKTEVQPADPVTPATVQGTVTEPPLLPSRPMEN
ncbi:cache domain-containing protein [uncultured Desulfosarcina sp.]|uniref:cache domain-containing protein n=1 Tax=uncultured Desulfosarcina sp. TaxID=218289 RepID=UPI0029C6A6AB|nr:cache domain-containing protein [uncultured Desulfosarcina sp.]